MLLNTHVAHIFLSILFIMKLCSHCGSVFPYLHLGAQLCKKCERLDTVTSAEERAVIEVCTLVFQQIIHIEILFRPSLSALGAPSRLNT